MGTEDVNIDEWAVVSSPGGRYLGRVVSEPDESGAARDIKEYVHQRMAKGEPVKLSPAFDFLAPMRPVQTKDGKLGMQRDPIVTPPDFTVEEMPVYVQVHAVYFCSEMQKNDKGTYKDLVRGGLRTALGARAQQSGLELAGGLPPGPNRG